MIDDRADYYRVLQVDPAADRDVIKAAYKRLAQKFHPDVNPEPDAAERMAEIVRAYEILGDPERRALYDRTPQPSRTGEFIRPHGLPVNRRRPVPVKALVAAGAVLLGVAIAVLWSQRSGPPPAQPSATPSAGDGALLSDATHECYPSSRDQAWVDDHLASGSFGEVRQEWVETSTGRSRAWCFYR